ncbi:hypothetical protein BT69DRAFT_1301967 [Atractiella rhizophila]|nr:hypothetical protein BT69DRAFT_1301967 [Atractiella rhizophila]
MSNQSTTTLDFKTWLPSQPAASLDELTRKSYGSGLAKYLEYCKKMKLPQDKILPASKGVILEERKEKGQEVGYTTESTEEDWDYFHYLVRGARKLRGEELKAPRPPVNATHAPHLTHWCWILKLFLPHDKTKKRVLRPGENPNVFLPQQGDLKLCPGEALAHHRSITPLQLDNILFSCIDRETLHV